MEEIFCFLTSSIVSVLLYYQIYAIMGLVINLVVICLYIHFFKVIHVFIV